MAAGDVESTGGPAPGLLAAHVHLAADGERAIVVAEWTDALSHEATTAGDVSFKRYTLYHSFVEDV